jgi:hypothetical protein
MATMMSSDATLLLEVRGHELSANHFDDAYADTISKTTTNNLSPRMITSAEVRKSHGRLTEMTLQGALKEINSLISGT